MLCHFLLYKVIQLYIYVYTHTHIYIYTHILFHILFHYGLSQDTEYSSLCRVDLSKHRALYDCTGGMPTKLALTQSLV